MHPATRALIVLAGTTLVLLATVPAWGGGGGHAGACRAYADGPAEEVVMRDACFEPVAATAAPGTTLTVRNLGQMPHTYTAVDGSFDTGVLQPGESATVTVPDTAGTLPVYCTLHATPDGTGMAGVLTVAAAPLEAGAASPLTPAGVGILGGLALGVAGTKALAGSRSRRGRP